MRLIEINWCPNEKFTIEYILEYVQPQDIEKMFGINGYERMDNNDRKTALCDLFRHAPAKLDAFWKLPSEVELPERFTAKDAEEFAWEWLEYEYGTAVDGFKIEIDSETVLEKGVITGVEYERV